MYICTASGDTALQTLCPHAVVGEQQFLAAAHAGADRHHQPPGVDLGRARVLPRPPADDGGHLLQVGEPTQFDPRQLAVEVLQQMPTDAHRQVVLLDEVVIQGADAALPSSSALPGAVGVGCQGSRHGKTGDDNVGETASP